MSASGVQGWPVAGIAQTRTVAPASGVPRELKTMSSLREPCARASSGASATNTSNPPSASAMRANPLSIQKIPCIWRNRIIVFLSFLERRHVVESATRSRSHAPQWLGYAWRVPSKKFASEANVKMKKLLAGSCVVVLALLAGAVAQAQNFRGLYVGGNLGGGFGRINPPTTRVFSPTC